MSHLRQILATASVLGCLASASVFADPVVEGIDLVSAIRVDRTTFDYTYRLRVQGDSKSYVGGSFTVQTNVLGTAILKANVDIGRIDAGEFLRSTDNFTIRQDRQTIFDRTKLVFSFNGKVLASSDFSAASAPTIGIVSFIESGGRAGHGATTEIQGLTPAAGTTVLLATSLLGEINFAEYSVRNLSGDLIANGVMSRPSAGVRQYFAQLTVPAVPFKVTVKATAPNGASNSWESKIFSPPELSVRLVPDSLILQFGKEMPVSIYATSSAASAEYIFSVIIPTGLTVVGGPWTVLVQPSQPTIVPFKIIPPLSGSGFTFQTVTVSYAPKSNPLQTRVSNLRFILEQ